MDITDEAEYDHFLELLKRAVESGDITLADGRRSPVMIRFPTRYCVKCGESYPPSQMIRDKCFTCYRWEDE